VLALRTQLDQSAGLIARCDVRILEVSKPFEPEIQRLQTIVGVGRRSAEVLVSEIGVDMSRFSSAGHLASWARVCPGSYAGVWGNPAGSQIVAEFNPIGFGTLSSDSVIEGDHANLEQDILGHSPIHSGFTNSSARKRLRLRITSKQLRSEP
jgi:hypothetical protein